MNDCMFIFFITLKSLLDMISPDRGVPGELRERLRRLGLQRVHYEHSWYGPLNKLFNVIFSGPRWMVKPQPPFRQEAAELSDEADPDTSISSYGVVVEHAAKFPDFAICQYTRSLTGDTLHAVVEVKSDASDYSLNCLQLGQYLDSQGGVAPDALGISIAGERVGIISEGAEPVQEFIVYDTAFIDFLADYAEQHE